MLSQNQSFGRQSLWPPSQQQNGKFGSFVHQEEGGSTLASSWAAGGSTTSEERMRAALKQIHASFTSECSDKRAVGLESLKLLTELENSCNETAMAIALVVVAGTAPAKSLKKACRDIQDVVVGIIVKKKEFVPASSVNHGAANDDDSMLPSSNSRRRGIFDDTRPRTHSEEYVHDTRNLALTILENSLEVLKGYKDVYDNSYDLKNAVSCLNAAFIRCVQVNR